MILACDRSQPVDAQAPDNHLAATGEQTRLVKENIITRIVCEPGRVKIDLGKSSNDIRPAIGLVGARKAEGIVLSILLGEQFLQPLHYFL